MRITSGARWGLRAYVCAWLFVLVSGCFHDKHPPTANAGADAIVNIGDTVNLDGSLSSDVDGDRLSYQWSFVKKPETSNATFDMPNSATPSFVADVSGDYVVQLVVKDGKKSSKPDFIHVLTRNQLPVAKAESTGGEVVNDRVTLDGNLSFDPEGQILFYQWNMILKPEQSLAVIDNPNSALTSFTPDVPGAYVIHLIVNDGEHPSAAAMIVVNIAPPARRYDSKPVAEAGPDQPLYDTGTIQLDGSGSTDEDNDPLSYRWTLSFKPKDSLAELSDNNVSNPTFNADIIGSYVAKLVVSDLNGDSHADTVVITPHENPELACQDCHEHNTAPGKPDYHMLTYDDCRNCHLPSSWQAIVGHFHAHGHRAKSAECVICHDGLRARATPEGHVQTTLDCNYCHAISNTTWIPARKVPEDPVFSHDGIFSGCLDCHDGIKQTGKVTGHITVSNRCNSCHETSAWLPAVHMEHPQVFDSRCAECHNLPF